MSEKKLYVPVLKFFVSINQQELPSDDGESKSIFTVQSTVDGAAVVSEGFDSVDAAFLHVYEISHKCQKELNDKQ